MGAEMLVWASVLFWTTCGLLLCFALAVTGFLVVRTSRVDPVRRSLLQQEVVWTVTSALLVVGLAMASDVTPWRTHSASAVRVH